MTILYQAINVAVLEAIPRDAHRVLDVGCGTGSLGATLKARQTCEVVGITFSEAEADLAKQSLDRVVVADLNTCDPAFLGRFDCIVCSHVLEHLYRPEELLRRLQPCLEPKGELLIALPNVLFWRQRLRFLSGQFKYDDAGGLMDSTHYRFFDWSTAQELVVKGGYELKNAVAEGYVPLFYRWPTLRRSQLNVLVSRWFPGLFGLQFLLTAVSNPARVSEAPAERAREAAR